MSAPVTAIAMTKNEEEMLSGCLGRPAKPLDPEPEGVRG